MPSTKSTKILVIRLSSLGDILLSYPLIHLLKTREKNSTLHFLVKEQFAQAVETNPFIDEVIKLNPENISDIKSIIRFNKYDMIIDLQNNLRSYQLYLFNYKSRIYRFKKPTLKKFLLVNFKFNLLKENPSMAVQYIRSVYNNFKSDELELYFNIPQKIEEAADQKLSDKLKERPIIGICPGSKHFTKRYPVELWQQVVKELIAKGFSIAIFGGVDDKQICKSLVLHNDFIQNFQNNNDLFETAALMKKCSVVITNDSGLMHLASLLKIPVVAIFGSTVREFGFFPIYEKSIIVENDNLNCRPCSHIGKSKCPEKHFKCMVDISPNYIVQKIDELISGRTIYE